MLCLFVLYCVLLSQGLKANALSTLFGALAAVPLTVHLYRRVLPAAVSQQGNGQQSGTAFRDIANNGSEGASLQASSAGRQ